MSNPPATDPLVIQGLEDIKDSLGDLTKKLDELSKQVANDHTRTEVHIARTEADLKSMDERMRKIEAQIEKIQQVGGLEAWKMRAPWLAGGGAAGAGVWQVIKSIIEG